jgi:hypothetical protein
MSLLSSATASSAQAIVTGDQLSIIAESVRQFIPIDSFDTPPPSPPLAGKRFSYVVSPLETGPNNVICTGSPRWTYRPQNGELDIGYSAGSLPSERIMVRNKPVFSSAEPSLQKDRSLDLVTLKCAKSRPPSYVASNGFGAQREITREDEIITSIAASGSNFHREWKGYWSTSATGDAARTLLRNLRVRVSGTLEDWAGGRSVVCGSYTTTPTVSFPFEKMTNACLFKGKIDQIEIFNIITGDVIHTASQSLKSK